MCVVGFAYSKKIRCWVTCRQLDDVRYQSSGTETKNMNTYNKKNLMIKHISRMMLQSKVYCSVHFLLLVKQKISVTE